MASLPGAQATAGAARARAGPPPRPRAVSWQQAASAGSLQPHCRIFAPGLAQQLPRTRRDVPKDRQSLSSSPLVLQLEFQMDPRSATPAPARYRELLCCGQGTVPKPSSVTGEYPCKRAFRSLFLKVFGAKLCFTPRQMLQPHPARPSGS